MARRRRVSSLSRGLLVVPAAIGLRRRWLWGSWVGSIALAGTVAACGQVSVRSPSLAQGQQATLIQIVYSAPAAEKVRNDSPVLVRKVDAITGQVLGDDRQLGKGTLRLQPMLSTCCSKTWPERYAAFPLTRMLSVQSALPRRWACLPQW